MFVKEFFSSWLSSVGFLDFKKAWNFPLLTAIIAATSSIETNHFFGRINSYLVNICVNNNIIWLSLSIIHSVVKWPRPIQTLCAKAFASFALVWIVVSVWSQSDLYRNNFCDVYTVCRREFILLWQLTEAWLHIVVILSFPLWLVKWAVMKT